MVEGEIVYLPDSEDWKFTFTVDSSKLDEHTKYVFQQLLLNGRGFIEHDADFMYVAGVITRQSRGQGRMAEP